MANLMTLGRSNLSPFSGGSFDDLDRLMDNLFGNLRLTVRPDASSAQSFAPRVDITENENALELTADLPGLESGDVSLDITDNILTIQGERKTETEQKDRTVYRLERTSGSFLRRVALPVEVDAEQAEATFKNGVLKVTLPKSAQSKPKQIAIRAE